MRLEMKFIKNGKTIASFDNLSPAQVKIVYRKLRNLNNHIFYLKAGQPKSSKVSDVEYEKLKQKVDSVFHYLYTLLQNSDPMIFTASESLDKIYGMVAYFASDIRDNFDRLNWNAEIQVVYTPEITEFLKMVGGYIAQHTISRVDGEGVYLDAQVLQNEIFVFFQKKHLELTGRELTIK